VGALDVLDTVVGDGVGVPVVGGAVGAADDASEVGTGDEAQGAEGEFQFGAGAKIELGDGLGAAVEVDGHGDDGGLAGVQGVDVAQVVEVAILLFVVQVNPAVVADDDVVLQPLEHVGVLPAAAGHNAGNEFGPAAEPDGAQELLEDGNIGAGLTCQIRQSRHL
jgi:hypothetical protein